MPNHAFLGKTEFQAHLGQLRGLTRAGLASHNDDLVITNGRLNVFAALADGQLFGVGNHSGNQRVVGALFGPVPVVLVMRAFLRVLEREALFLREEFLREVSRVAPDSAVEASPGFSSDVWDAREGFWVRAPAPHE